MTQPTARPWFGPARPPEPLPADPILDMHCHVAGIGAGGSGCRISAALRRSFKYGLYLRAFGVTHEEMMAHGDVVAVARFSQRLAASRHVTGAVVLALDAPVTAAGEPDWDHVELYVPTDWLARQVRQYPNLYLGASVNPLRRDALARLDEAAAAGAVLLKWLPAIQRLDVSDRRLVPFYRRLAELRLPLLTHVGAERSFTHADDDAGDPERLRLALDLGVTVIAAHLASTGRIAGQRQFDRLLAMFPQYPHLYGDISSLTQLNKLGYLDEALRRPDLFDRLLYGSDMPLPRTPVVSAWYFPRQLRLRQIRAIQREANEWDRDVLLKQALGVPAAVFTRAAGLLRLPHPLPPRPPGA